MEKFSNIPTDRDSKKSALHEAYLLLGATTPLELSNRYSEEDQILFKSGEWDYEKSSFNN